MLRNIDRYLFCQLSARLQKDVFEEQPFPQLHFATPYKIAEKRWFSLLEENNSKPIWSAIGWKGTFDRHISSHSMPSNKDFSDHFEKTAQPS